MSERLSSSLPSPVSVTSFGPQAEHREVSGEWLIVGLVVSLLTFMFITFATTAYFLRGDDWLVLVAPAARLTHSASFGLAAFCGVDAWRKGRNGWWLYVLAGGLPVVQWGVVVYWMVTGRDRPRRLLKWKV